MKYCQHCGVQLEDSARFCPHCGTPVPDPAVRKPAAPGQDQTAAADDRRQPEVTRPIHKRQGIAAQFDAIAAGQKPQGSCLTYWYGFFQLLYHKSFGLFARTYLPCCLALCLDIALLAYASAAEAGMLLALSVALLLVIAVWFVVLSFWLSRRYPQELYKQVNGDADRIPNNFLAPVLGGIVLLALVLLALATGLAAGSPDAAAADPSASTSEPTAQKEPAATPEPVATEPPAPTEAPAESDTVQNAAPQTADDGSWLVTAQEPWKGAWIASDGSQLMVFENTMSAQDNAVPNDDGSITIYRADARDGVVYSVYTFSADQTTLTEEDAEGNLVGIYVRPTYEMASTPLPSSYWGAYALVEDNTITDYNPFGELAQFGPAEDFILDAFRFGNAPYQRLVDYGDGTWSAYLLIPPEGGEITFGFTTEGENLYMEIYDLDGNIRGRYLRTAQ